MADCRCPRCLVVGRPKPLTQEQAKSCVERFIKRVKIIHKTAQIDGQVGDV